MSQRLINRSPDLRRLQAQGYEIEVHASGYLVIGHVPYVTQEREVRYGQLLSSLDLAGDVTIAPTDHVAYFTGLTPCDRYGLPLSQVINQHCRQELAPGLAADLSFSSKPAQGYADYFDKMTTYVHLIAGPAESIEPAATARTFQVVEPGDAPTVFRYLDTASSRAGIADLTAKLHLSGVAIVGLGGTGSYILDLVAKTPVTEIHLFDGDDFLQHNAFRTPGAASLGDLQARQKKTAYLAETYSQMRSGVVSHPYLLDETNVSELDTMRFVFVAVDDGPAKRVIVDHLEARGVSFIDVGMGLWHGDHGLGGSLRVTTSTVNYRDGKRRLSFDVDDQENQYNTNAQIADLNALNATLAVIKWKKLCGFYLDLEHEHSSIYELDGNTLINEDAPG